MQTSLIIKKLKMFAKSVDQKFEQSVIKINRNYKNLIEEE